MLLALAGGVGGAKLAAGLEQVLGEALTVVVNTGDDFEHLGLAISPDLDTVMYTLAGLNNTQTGWGLAGETWNFMAMTERLGGETWFRLGDQDLAIHVERTQRLGCGESLSGITARLCARLGVRCTVAPMTDQRVRTVVLTDGGELAFQHYFVRLRCEPVLRGLRFEGAARANMSAVFADTLAEAALEAIVLCPSNPYLSVQPILQLAGVRQALRHRRVPCVAVSPIVGGHALKGPAAKIMRELGHAPSALEVAKHYAGLGDERGLSRRGDERGLRRFIDGFVLDHADAALAPAVESLGVRTCVTDTIMRDRATAATLAAQVVSFARSLS